ncbi:hypothetical protein M422DRAFT_177172 [Sphaerobolus stellatus SS14]|uniref:DDE-1 domain-containing protein n=1 Tax=Sphaerobolus stellatus (strain SS14) TaxID=990650 RepID=A0A0C9U4Y8_SPHS4|nr:hypothetical protein M422DRAFT_177172 [Sphaerobolus stellatus SS14]
MSGCKPSNKWVAHFLEWHLEVSVYHPHPLDPKRAQAFNPTTIDAYFDLLEDVIAHYEVPVENIYNTDEKGVNLVAFNNNILLLAIPPKTTHKLQPLDVGVFGPFQTAWVKHCEDCHLLKPCDPL